MLVLSQLREGRRTMVLQIEDAAEAVDLAAKCADALRVL